MKKLLFVMMLLGVWTLGFANVSADYAPGPVDFVLEPKIEQGPAIDAAWSTKAPMPETRAHHMVSPVINNKYYTFGGPLTSGGAQTNHVREYDVMTNTWTTKAAMTTTRSIGGAALAGGKIYVMGGCVTFGTGMNVVEIYDPATDAWTTGPAMPAVNHDFGTAVYNDTWIYVVGGGNWSTTSPPVATVYMLNTITNTWTTATPLPAVFGGSPCCGVIGNKLIAATGYTAAGGANTVYVGTINTANPGTITWTTGLTKPGVLVYRANRAVSNNHLYVVGGNGPTARVGEAYKYDPVTNTWTQLPNKPTACSNVYGMGYTATGAMYYPGGYTTVYINNHEMLDDQVFTTDVGVDAIISPGATHMINTAMTPSALVKNYGAAAQTNFAVVCSIFGPGNVFRYTNTQMVASLATQATTTVNFPSWTPTVEEQLNVMMKTTLAGDEFPGNDRKTRTCLVADIYTQDFETSDGNYVADPLTGAWAWGVPTVGPPGAHSGTKLWATVLGGNYAVSSNWKLTSEQYTASANNPTLKFWQWYDIETNWDGGNVKISTDGGNTWTLLTPVGGYNGTANTANAGIPGEPCFTGGTTGNFWHEVEFPLTLNTGQTFHIRWHFGSDGSVNYAGWYIDDVTGIGFAPQPPATNDVGVQAVRAPGANHAVNTQMTPIALVKNFGTAAQTNFPVVCSVIGTGNAVRYTNTKTVASLAVGDTIRVNFDAWTPTITEDVTVAMRTNLTGDANPGNDRRTQSTNVTSALLSEGFNDPTFPPSGWQAIPLVGTYNWQRYATGTNPTCTPFEGAGMAGYPCYSATTGSARLISPAVAMGATAVPCTLKFHMYHDNMYSGGTYGPDSVKVETSINGTSFTRVAAFMRYGPVNQWEEHVVYLGAFSGNLWLGLLAFSQYGNNIFIDNVRLYSPSTGIEENGNSNIYVTALNTVTPNPVSGNALISFNIAKPTQASLRIYDASGRIIRTLVNGHYNTGTYNLTWNGRD
ncbi:MAG: immune inhibitor A, partial [Candidatus Latescibacteria bacterium]|nr:immune inhibitor A [Candidatus Latescibacterota bacterium]